MTNERTVLITGATGKQGGAVARELAGKGFALRAMTRKPEGDPAKGLARLGVEVVPGDLNDPESVKRALHGAWGVFAVQNTWEAGVVEEEAQGKRLATLSRAAGIQHFVYSSVGSAHRKTGIPHFDNKFRVEERVRSLKFPSHVILRPVFFMDNLVSAPTFSGDNLYVALSPATLLQMIAVEDIGRHGARAFVDSANLSGREIDIAGDEITLPAAAEALSHGLGRKITFVSIPIADVRKISEDLATMLEWFERVGYNVDIAALERESGIKPTRIAEWAAKQKV